ncbi:hypothetical protein FJZ21_03615 [Candidatus Pacearchaeota archaeon]|nr:hypothetical protein [Candidatus Pacearchaeota archaeon]
MKKSLLSLLGSLIALAPLKAQDNPKETLVLHQPGDHQRAILNEVKARYGDSAEYVELSPTFPSEILSKNEQDRIIKANGMPKQVLVLADYNSFTPASVKAANQWIRQLDSDPFPDARISFFPSHPQYVEELKRLVQRQSYSTQSALTRFDDQVISFAEEGVNVDHRNKLVQRKKDGIIVEEKTTDQSKDYLAEANSGSIDYIARFGHSGPGFWQSTDLQNSFWTVDINGETLLVNPGTSALKTKKEGEKYTGELNLEALVKRDKSRKYPRVSSPNPKIVDAYAACNTILPPHNFEGNELSTVMSNMVGNNAYFWGYEKEVIFVPQAGSHQLLFWGSNGANSFTNSLLGSTIWITAEREKLERDGNKGLDYQILKSDELSGMFFGLPDNLTTAKTSSRMYDQAVNQNKTKDGIQTEVEINLRSRTERNDYRMEMWSPPVIILDNPINPTQVKEIGLEVDGKSYTLRVENRKTYSTTRMPQDLGEITLTDNAIVLGIAPVYKDGKQKYKEIERDQRIRLSFDSN